MIIGQRVTRRMMRNIRNDAHDRGSPAENSKPVKWDCTKAAKSGLSGIFLLFKGITKIPEWSDVLDGRWHFSLMAANVVRSRDDILERSPRVRAYFSNSRPRAASVAPAAPFCGTPRGADQQRLQCPAD